jgi:hypothetical protein
VPTSVRLSGGFEISFLPFPQALKGAGCPLRVGSDLAGTPKAVVKAKSAALRAKFFAASSKRDETLAAFQTLTKLDVNHACIETLLDWNTTSNNFNASFRFVNTLFTQTHHSH